MTLARVVVHDSVGIAFDPDRLVAALSDLPVAVETGDASGLGTDDAVVAADPGPALLDAGWVHAVGSATGAPRDRYAAAGVVLTTTPDGDGGETAVAETAVGYLLTLARRLHVYRDNQRERTWARAPHGHPFTLDGERVCVVGLGSVGRGVARRAAALGTTVVGVGRGTDRDGAVASDPDADHLARRYPPGAVDRAAADARFVVVAAPPSTLPPGLVDAETLAALSASSYLVDVGRGDAVDPAALSAALDEGTLAGAIHGSVATDRLAASPTLWPAGDDAGASAGDGDGDATGAGGRDRWLTAVADAVRTNVDRMRAGEDPAHRVV